jgi:hypothetical protein
MAEKSSERFAPVERFDYEWTSSLADKRQAFFDAAGETHNLCVGRDGDAWAFVVTTPYEDGEGRAYWTFWFEGDGFATFDEAVEAAMARAVNYGEEPEGDLTEHERDALAADAAGARASLRPRE